jgi:hypothetical protein
VSLTAFCGPRRRFFPVHQALSTSQSTRPSTRAAIDNPWSYLAGADAALILAAAGGVGLPQMKRRAAAVDAVEVVDDNRLVSSILRF